MEPARAGPGLAIPHAENLLTVCTDNRRPGLTIPDAAEAILRELRAMEKGTTWELRCAVIMPDHVHLRVVLGERLSLGKCVSRFKTKSVGAMRSTGTGVGWEPGFFDHHVRPGDDRLSLLLSIHLNPYRAERWLWYHCREGDWAWFRNSLDADRPAPEWLM